jgi:hypothetical protein
VLREVTDTIMDAVTALLAEVRGETPPAERYVHRRAEPKAPRTPTSPTTPTAPTAPQATEEETAE